MALDPMPYGSGEFSFTMDTSLAYLCPPAPAPTPMPTPTPAPPPTPVAQDDTHCNEHMESLDERLAGASSELRKTREDVRLKQHKIASLLDLRRRNKHELDRIRHRNHLQSRQMMEAITPSGGVVVVSGRHPAPSSSSPVAVHPLAMSNNPFALPRPAAVASVAAQEGKSRALALQVPRFAPVVVGDDRSAAAAAPAQLQILAVKSPLASSSSPVAFHRPPMINPFAVPRSAAVVAHEGTSTATAIQVPSEDMSAASANQLQILAAKSSLASSSSPVAIHRPPMINPFAVPSPAAVVVHEGTSAATAILVPSEDGSAAAAPQLQLKAAKSPLASSSSPVAVDRPAMIKVPSSAASAAVVEESSSAAAVAHLAATRPLALDGRTALFGPYSVAHTPVVSEYRSAEASAHLGLLAARRPLALHAPALVGKSSVARGAAIVAYRSAADLEMLAAKRPLPQKGRLVQAVMEAGPLLENLMVAGPLPRWRNPPTALAQATAMTSAPSSSGAQMGLPWSAH